MESIVYGLASLYVIISLMANNYGHHYSIILAIITLDHLVFAVIVTSILNTIITISIIILVTVIAITVTIVKSSPLP